MMGSYRHGRSYLHLLDPRTKIAMMIGLSILVYSVEIPSLAILSGIVLLMAAVCGLPIKRLAADLRPVSIFFAVIFMVHFMFTPGELLIRGSPLLTIEGAEAGGVMVVRFMLLILYTSILLHTTSPSQLNNAVAYFLGPFGTWGRNIAFMTGVAMSFIPFMFREKRTVERARAARGIGGFNALIVPLLYRSFRRADELSDALESRCYRPVGRYYYRTAFGWRDAVAGGVFAGMVVLGLLGL